jgi:hypothetical protein
MRRRFPAVATALSCSTIFLIAMTVRGTGSADDGKTTGNAAGTDLFGLTRVVKLHIKVPAEEYAALQPPPPAGFGAPPPPPRPKRPGERESERNLFGVEFHWARADLIAEGKTYKGTELRYSGNASYMASAGGLKRSFMVDLERSDNPDFHSLHAFLLQSGSLDPGGGREGRGVARLRPLPHGGRAGPPHGDG